MPDVNKKTIILFLNVDPFLYLINFPANTPFEF